MLFDVYRSYGSGFLSSNFHFDSNNWNLNEVILQLGYLKGRLINLGTLNTQNPFSNYSHGTKKLQFFVLVERSQPEQKLRKLFWRL